MARVQKNRKRQGSSLLLARHRHPEAASKPASSLSSKAGRTLIRTHHTLQKKLAQALQAGDEAAAHLLRTEIEAKGGLEKYQQASINGQNPQRGGDSSKILMEWLSSETAPSVSRPKMRLLEVGCLSPHNAVSKSPLFEVTRIDLHSQHPAILEQDFMQRPLPTGDDERFDLISLSLVLNYVPDPVGRGEMLRRTTHFLRRGQVEGEFFPSLFLVLPAPCVTNSRYLDEERLEGIMESLGYKLVKRKLSAKLIYGLWCLREEPRKVAWKKEEVRSGKSRNNFAVVVK